MTGPEAPEATLGQLSEQLRVNDVERANETIEALRAQGVGDSSILETLYPSAHPAASEESDPS